MEVDQTAMKWAKFLFDIGYPFDMAFTDQVQEPPEAVMQEVARLWWEYDRRPEALVDYVDLVYSEARGQ